MGCKLIVVDSEPIVRELVRSILEREGFTVMATAEIDVAVDSCKRQKPDLILTNVFLHGITGHEAMKRLKQECPKVPVLMVSGLPQTDVIEEWQAQSGFDVFPKPFDAQSLIAKVREVLSKGAGVLSARERGQKEIETGGEGGIRTPGRA